MNFTSRPIAYAEFHPTIMGARQFLLVDPADMMPRLTQFLSLVDWSGFGVEE